MSSLRSQQSLHDRLKRIPISVRLVAGLLLLTLVGTLLLMLPGVGAHGQLSPNQAFFTAVSALSVTGLSTITPSTDLTPVGHLLLLILIQLGGFGFMAVAIIVMRLMGRKVSLMDRLALRDSLDLLVPTAIIKLTQRIILIVLAIEGTGALLLWVHWRGALGDERAIGYAIFHAVSAFCNAGFDLFGGLEQFPAGLPTDAGTLIILGSLIVVGGLGIPVLADMFMWQQRRRLTLHTRVMLSLTITLIVVGALGIFLAESQSRSISAQLPWERRLLLATFQSVSSRTAGFSALPSFEQLTSASQAFMLLLMFIGSAPASMGGGITLGTFAVLLVALWSYVRGMDTAQIGQRVIPQDTVRKATAILLISLGVVFVATWLILLTHPVSLNVALFEVVSAFATCGLTLAFTGQLDLLGQGVIAAVMFWGRLGALTMVTALAHPRIAPRVTYPEDQILIG